MKNPSRRLVVCLDGTWNDKGSSTNVLHHYTLTQDFAEPDTEASQDSDASTKLRQLRYYHAGVGTGVLDGFTGGAFGIGLEANVRAAYEWLVEHFQEGDETTAPDEIYIFGFSRGAYTARSLVGLIASRGLLRRGAPISVNQIWSEYAQIGREREQRTSFWDRVFGRRDSRLRRINDLIVDPWNVQRFEKLRANSRIPENPRAERLPGQLADDLTDAEKLLIRWSRRVRITYLGVYDTVGAIGIDALAIPGLTGKLAMHHNLNATTLIQSCRHALAVDEHRSSFQHSPLVEYIGHGDVDEDEQHQALDVKDARRRWKRRAAMWRRKIEQRWFVGAHSNVGGGYPNNELAQRPLQWVIEGARLRGLECSDLAVPCVVPPSDMPARTDSYLDFARPFLTEVVRAKRNYRQIAPERECRARVRQPDGNPEDIKEPGEGFALRSINEKVDNTVLEWAASRSEYVPPNLVEYARRILRQSPETDQRHVLERIYERKPSHSWLGASAMRHGMVILWAVFAAIGLAAMSQLFTSADLTSVLTVCLTAGILVLVDFYESWAGFDLATRPNEPRRQAAVDAVYWVRMIGFALFVAGLLASIPRLWQAGWYADTLTETAGRAWERIDFWIPAGVTAAAVMLTTAVGFDRQRWKTAMSGILLAIVAAIGLVYFVCLGGFFAAESLIPTMERSVETESPAPANATTAGMLILLQVGCVYLINSFRWVGTPMTRAHLGSIVSLQKCATPDAVCRCLERWRKMLACRWDKDDTDDNVLHDGPAARSLRNVLSNAIWRDIIGFIPVYSVVFALAIWFGMKILDWASVLPNWIPDKVWIWIPLIAAVTDWLEDFSHLHYLSLHQKKRRPRLPLTLFAVTMTTLKFVMSFLGLLCLAAALTHGTWKVMELRDSVGWRGSVALVISSFSLLTASVIVSAGVIYRIRGHATD